METAIGEMATGSRSVGIARNRDWELVRLVGRHGVVTIEQAMAAMGVGRTATYRRAAALIKAGLLERLDLLRSEPSLLHATREGLRYAGLGMPVAKVSPGAVDHWLRCTEVAIKAARHYGKDRVLTEREIALAEAIEERPIASVEVGTIHGRPRMHRADLAVLREEGTIAIEVELTPKAPRRLENLLRHWRRAMGTRVVSEVHYLCEPGQTRRAVERAASKVRAERVIVIGEAPAR
jgi:hypothetical protein